jgi:3-phenylpropionate/trans-cinnamate dioxygenase ferredoxin reductase subunit
MSTPESIVIVGGGLAGANAAFELRERGFAGRVALVSDEDRLPYERPPLSKTYLRGEEPLEKALVKAANEYEEQRVELIGGRRVEAIDLAARRVRLADGSELAYDGLLLATGSAPRKLDVPGADLEGVHYLRDLDDADAIRAAAEHAAAVVVIGGGWMGTEVAASLRQLGRDVKLISNVPRPLSRILGDEVAEIYRRLHIENGVEIVQGAVSAVEGDTRASGVRLGDERRIAADLVVAGVGAVPRTDLAEKAGLELAEGGVAADEYLRTSDPAVYVAGDIAAAWHPTFGVRLRLEHWDNAIRQGKAAAANMLGANEPYARVPYFYSDQFDLGMEYRGFARTWNEVVIRGDAAAREFDAFWLVDGRIAAAMNANRWDDADALQTLVESEARVEPGRLADLEVPLTEVA